MANRHGPKPGSKLRSQRKLATSSGRRPQTSAFMCRNFQSQILWTKSGTNFRTTKSPEAKALDLRPLQISGRWEAKLLSLVKLWSPQKNPMDIMHRNFLKTLCVSLSFDCWWLLWVTTIHIIDTMCASKKSMFTHTFFTSRIQKLDIHSQKNRWPTCIYVLGSKL